MFHDPHNFKIVDDEDGRRYAFHYRDLGVKANEMYPEKKWSDVVINDVPIDLTMNLQDRDEFLHIIGEASSYRETTISEPNERSVPLGVLSSGEDYPSERNKKESREKTSIRWKKGVKRERTIPPSKKKYPTKPKKKRGDKFVKKRGMRKSSEKEYFEYEVNDESIPLEKVYRGITCEACL